jgi:hypothetical protein
MPYIDAIPISGRCAFFLVVKPNSRQGGNNFLEWDKTTAWQHVTREEADRAYAVDQPPKFTAFGAVIQMLNNDSRPVTVTP